MHEALKAKIRSNTEHYYRDVLGLPDWASRIEGRLDRKYEAHMFQRLLKFAGSLEGKSVLDLGCGWGGVVLNAAPQAGLAVGLEPDEERLAIAQELVGQSGQANVRVMKGVGEKLPFEDNTFDVIASYQVLEHVQDPARVVSEVARVLKPGGVFHFSTPNYLAFYEPHYKVFWLPLLPKALGRLYLRLRGRKAGFLDHLNYVNPISIRRLLRRHGLDFVDVHYQKATAKLESILSRWLGVGRLLQPLARRLIFCVHTCFLNQDQEYVAVKA